MSFNRKWSKITGLLLVDYTISSRCRTFINKSHRPDINCTAKTVLVKHLEILPLPWHPISAKLPTHGVVASNQTEFQVI